MHSDHLGGLPYVHELICAWQFQAELQEFRSHNAMHLQEITTVKQAEVFELTIAFLSRGNLQSLGVFVLLDELMTEIVSMGAETDKAEKQKKLIEHYLRIVLLIITASLLSASRASISLRTRVLKYMYVKLSFHDDHLCHLQFAGKQNQVYKKFIWWNFHQMLRPLAVLTFLLWISRSDFIAHKKLLSLIGNVHKPLIDKCSRVTVDKYESCMIYGVCNPSVSERPYYIGESLRVFC